MRDYKAWSKIIYEKVLRIDFDEKRVVVLANDKTAAYELDFDDVILMQCTGLKTENDEEIYEGDILNFTFEDGSKRDTGVVKYLEDRAYFVVENKEHSYVLGYCWDFKVIGNIYKSKEFLE